MSLSDRLRGVITPLNRPRTSDAVLSQYVGRNFSSAARSTEDIAETLGGEWHEYQGHRYLVVDRKYGPGHRHGRVTLADALPRSDDAWPRLSLLARTAVRGRLMFFDLETTGLAGGAGTYAFLVGCGWFEPPSPAASAGHAGCFRVRQFFLSAFNAEAAMLAGVATVAGDAGAIVTYNGKSFDLPLIENRFVIHRMPPSLSELPHIDILHAARRFWRDNDADAMGQSNCRLTALERTQCGFEREDDIQGFEVPSRYFAYVRSGNAQPLAAVCEHNRLDLISLAMLTARTAEMLEEGPAATRSAREAFGLGRTYELAGMIGDARRCYGLAAGIEERGSTGARPFADFTRRAEALRAWALLNRRERRFDAAAEGWQRLLQLPDCPAPLAREASEALAVHHEHRLRDAVTARRFASQTLLFPSTVGRTEAARYRLARLDRKLSGTGRLTLQENPAD